MALNNQKRARKQDQAIAALLEEPTISKAAKKAGVGERTLLRWLKLDDFQAAYRIAQREVLSHAIAQIHQATSESVKTFRSIMMDESAPASARVAAAKIVLEVAIKGVEREDRLNAIEQNRLEEILREGSRWR